MEAARPRRWKEKKKTARSLRKRRRKASLKGALSRFRECATHDCLKIHSFIRCLGSPVRPPPFSPWQHVGSKEVVSFTRTNAHGRMLGTRTGAHRGVSCTDTPRIKRVFIRYYRRARARALGWKPTRLFSRFLFLSIAPSRSPSLSFFPFLQVGTIYWVCGD